MGTANSPDVRRPHLPSKARKVFEVALAVPAVGLTLFAVVNAWLFIFDDWIGGEVLATQLGLLVTGFLAVLAWAGVVALHKSVRRKVHDGWRRATTAAVSVALGAAVVAVLGGLGGWMLWATGVVAAVSSVVALVASIRM